MERRPTIPNNGIAPSKNLEPLLLAPDRFPLAVFYTTLSIAMSRFIFAILLVPLAIPVTVLAQDETAPVETVKSTIPQSLDPPAPQPRLWSICELFEDLGSHEATVVAVRGLLYQSRESLALGGRCQSKFVTRYLAFPGLPGVIPGLTAEYVWPTAISLAYSTNQSEGNHP
jgi:hypothetical protein